MPPATPCSSRSRTGPWDHGRSSASVRLEGAATPPTRAYQVQGAIAACHAEAVVAADTDWPQIVQLYDELERYLPTPTVALNRAVAIAMAEGPEAGLLVVDELAEHGALDGYHLLPATRADLLRRLGRRDEAAAAYRAALALTTADPERRYLARRLAEVEG